MNLDEQVTARLVTALERAATADRLRGLLDTARAELGRAEESVDQVTAGLRDQQAQAQRLETPSVPRWVKFARGTLDEELRVQRAEIDRLRGQLREAYDRLEDAQVETAQLDERLADLADAAAELDQALEAKEEQVLASGDWRITQLRGLRRRHQQLVAERHVVCDLLPLVDQARLELDALVRSARTAMLVSVSTSPVALRDAVDRVGRSRSALDQVRDALADLPSLLPRQPYATPLPRPDLLSPEVVRGISSVYPDLLDLRRAADSQLARLVVVEERLHLETARLDELLAGVAGVRQRLLSASDRSPTRRDRRG